MERRLELRALYLYQIRSHLHHLTGLPESKLHTCHWVQSEASGIHTKGQSSYN